MQRPCNTVSLIKYTWMREYPPFASALSPSELYNISLINIFTYIIHSQITKKTFPFCIAHFWNLIIKSVVDKFSSLPF